MKEDKLLNKLAEKAGMDLSRKIDSFVFVNLQKQAPFAYWILKRKFFQKRWVAKLFKLELRQHQLNTDMSYVLEVCIYGRVIGKARVSQIDVVNL